MIRTVAILLASISLVIVSPAIAGGGIGSKTLKHSSGAKVKIKCNSSSCSARHTQADGTKDKAVFSAGSQLDKLVSDWGKKGYK